MNVKEQKRLLVLNEVLSGRMTGQEAAEMMAPNDSTSVIALATTNQFPCVTEAETKKGSFVWQQTKLPSGRGGEDIQQSENSLTVIEELT